MVGLGDEDGGASRMGIEHHAVPHGEGLRDLPVERRAEGVGLIAIESIPVGSERHAHEERAGLGIGAVLLGIEHVRSVSREEAGDGRHDAGPVGTVDEEAGVVAAP